MAVIAAGLALWWTARRPLSDGERAIVGAWRVRVEGTASNLPVEYEFRPDRTCVIRPTGPGGMATPDATWRRTGDTLVVRYPGQVVGPWWDVVGVGRPMYEVLTLTPDGPDRFRYRGGVDADGRPWPSAQPSVTGVLVRPAGTP